MLLAAKTSLADPDGAVPLGNGLFKNMICRDTNQQATRNLLPFTLCRIT
jgi:hypothetical protein